jgi:hypothetical protein
MHSTSCTSKRHIVITEADYFYAADESLNYKYGNSYTWDGKKYTLVDTISFWNLVDNYSKLGNYHYTCANNTGTCTSLYYVFSSYDRHTLRTFQLKNGIDIDEVLNRNLINDDINQKDSAVKKTLDEWYKNNLLSYTSYLEDAVWCNDRSLQTIGGFNPNSGEFASSLYHNGKQRYDSGKPSVECLMIRDSFTVNEKNGNGALTYPIGLPTSDEVVYAGGNYTSNGKFYLNAGAEYHLMTPRSFSATSYGTLLISTTSDGKFVNRSPSNKIGVRPMISLKANTNYTSGDGTQANPYIIEL